MRGMSAVRSMRHCLLLVFTTSFLMDAAMLFDASWLALGPAFSHASVATSQFFFCSKIDARAYLLCVSQAETLSVSLQDDDRIESSSDGLHASHASHA